MTKIPIILRHFRDLDEKRIEDFKKALCQLKPRRGAGPIRMGNLKDKSIEKIAEFIFRYHTERHAVETIKKALEKINEVQIKRSIDKDLRDANKNNKKETQINKAIQRSKNMEIEKNKISISQVIKVKQDENQVFKISSMTLVPACDAVPCSESQAKKIRLVQEAPAVPGTSKQKEETASKNEEHRPEHQPSKPEPSQSKKSLPNISMEKETSNIMATLLKTLGEDGIARIRKHLCLVEPPFTGSKIQTRHIKDKSVEEMVDLIIRRHTMEHAQATVKKVLDRMG